MKESWRERHRNTLTRQRDDGERQAQNDVQSNRSSLLVPIDVNDTRTALTETTEIHHEEINTALGEDGPGSLSYMRDSLFSFGTTSEWAQFLSVNSGKADQSSQSLKRLSVTSHESLNRKREHWTKRRESSEHTTEDMEDEEHGSSFTAAQPSNPSPATSLNLLLSSISQDFEDCETAVKKRRMEDTRRVRFSEEVIILPESDDDNDDEENENNWQEEPSPRSAFPKWIVSLKSRRGKYKF